MGVCRLGTNQSSLARDGVLTSGGGATSKARAQWQRRQVAAQAPSADADSNGEQGSEVASSSAPAVLAERYPTNRSSRSRLTGRL